jgi:hypothetical protein
MRYIENSYKEEKKRYLGEMENILNSKIEIFISELNTTLFQNGQSFAEDIDKKQRKLYMLPKSIDNTNCISDFSHP